MEKMYTYNGKTQNLSKWAREYGLAISTLWGRIFERGMSFEQALVKKPEKIHRYLYRGKEYTSEELIAMNGSININIFHQRLYYGWDIERIVNTPKIYRGERSGLPKESTCAYDCFTCPYPDCIVG